MKLEFSIKPCKRAAPGGEQAKREFDYTAPLSQRVSHSLAIFQTKKSDAARGGGAKSIFDARIC